MWTKPVSQELVEYGLGRLEGESNELHSINLDTLIVLSFLCVKADSQQHV